MEKTLSCGNSSAGQEPTQAGDEMDALNDEVLLRIIEKSSMWDDHYSMRAVYPLVCKRWRDALYSAKGDVTLCSLSATISVRRQQRIY